MDNQDIEIFIENICNQISSEQAAKETYEEMKDHIETMVEEFTEKGLSEEEAIGKSLYNMGNPRKIGVGINKSHKKQVDVLGLVVISSIIIWVIIEILNLFSTPVDKVDKMFDLFNKVFLVTIVSIVGIEIRKMIKRRKIREESGENPLIIIRQVKKDSHMDQVIYAISIIPLSLGILSLIIIVFDSKSFIDLESIRYPYYMYIWLIVTYYSKQRPSAVYQSGIATPTEFLSWEKVDSYTFMKSRTKKGIVHELSVNYNKTFRRFSIKVPEEQLKAVSEIVRDKTQKT